MRHLFDPAGQRALAAAMRRQPLLAFDFDGTLVPMAEGPDDMLVADPIADGMRQLARLCPVAIITGLAVDDVADKADAMNGLVLGTGSRAAVFVGDDVDDEPVYARAPSSWLTVRIGRDDPSTLARFFVNDHDEVETMLAP
ncbi:MAG TPA: trehalose-phosphatase [Albitalea sp.]